MPQIDFEPDLNGFDCCNLNQIATEPFHADDHDPIPLEMRRIDFVLDSNGFDFDNSNQLATEFAFQ